MIRAFLAVEIGETLRSRIAQAQQDLKQRLSREVSKDVRISWVQPNSIHLTVKFFGDIDEELVGLLRDALTTFPQLSPAIEIPIDRLGAFPHLHQPQVLWVGPSEEWKTGEAATRLASLHRRVEACSRTLGLSRDDRPLSPHLTVARIKAGVREMGQAFVRSGVMDRWPVLGSLAVESMILLQSELLPGGPRYTKLWEIA